ncbi:MAG: DUF4783 domain-containing protein [Flavobacteriales bacterium]|nr:DUF4783 domain-containing protein [Flavobacteriales bacterium]
MRTLFVSFLMLIATGLFAQADITDQVAGYIKTANVKELAKHFADNIDLAVEEVDDIYSRAQAEQILKKFFDKNPPKNFTIAHSGTSKLGIEYRIGDLETANGKFRVHINLKKVGDVYQINQFRIEPA